MLGIDGSGSSIVTDIASLAPDIDSDVIIPDANDFATSVQINNLLSLPDNEFDAWVEAAYQAAGFPASPEPGSYQDFFSKRANEWKTGYSTSKYFVNYCKECNFGIFASDINESHPGYTRNRKPTRNNIGIFSEKPDDSSN